MAVEIEQETLSPLGSFPSKRPWPTSATKRGPTLA